METSRSTMSSPLENGLTPSPLSHPDKNQNNHVGSCNNDNDASSPCHQHDHDHDDHDDNDDDGEEEFDFIQSQWENGVETGLTISWPGSHRPLQLSTKLTEDRIAPLFDGTQWAGTRVWKAAVVALEYILSLNQDQRKKKNHHHPPLTMNGRRYSSLLELGCGLGVPAMIWHLLQETTSTTLSNNNSNGDGDTDSDESPPARVVLTDMPDLLPQLEANVRHNFPHSYGTMIQAKPLDWSREGLQELWQQEEQELIFHPNHDDDDDDDDRRRRRGPVFDICLNCDCIYEPLYGQKAWESLADVLAEVARLSPSTLIVTSVERRTADGVPDFCQRLQNSGSVQSIQRVLCNDDDPHHIIEVYITKGMEQPSTRDPTTLIVGTS